MPLRVNNNIAAINARRQLNANNRDLGIRLERLASSLMQLNPPEHPPRFVSLNQASEISE